MKQNTRTDKALYLVPTTTIWAVRGCAVLAASDPVLHTTSGKVDAGYDVLGREDDYDDWDSSDNYWD